MNVYQLPTVGRILHAYSTLWSGPRPAIVSNAFPGSCFANVNVFFDGANDTAALAEVRGSAHGNTFASVEVFAPLTTDERQRALEQARSRPAGADDIKIICEWPPRV